MPSAVGTRTRRPGQIEREPCDGVDLLLLLMVLFLGDGTQGSLCGDAAPETTSGESGSSGRGDAGNSSFLVARSTATATHSLNACSRSFVSPRSSDIEGLNDTKRQHPSSVTILKTTIRAVSVGRPFLSL